jgi:glycosyltransferase A (GT-A) superfamily protein (DUF2064 family)
MFEGVEWSSPRALTQTIAAFRRVGWEPGFLAEHYDVDDREALARLAAEPSLPPQTAAWLNAHRQHIL